MANELYEVQSSRESVLHELDELKVQLKLVEESRDSFRHSLMEANHQLREGLQLLHASHVVHVAVA